MDTNGERSAAQRAGRSWKNKKTSYRIRMPQIKKKYNILEGRTPQQIKSFIDNQKKPYRDKA